MSAISFVDDVSPSELKKILSNVTDVMHRLERHLNDAISKPKKCSSRSSTSASSVALPVFSKRDNSVVAAWRDLQHQSLVALTQYLKISLC